MPLDEDAIAQQLALLAEHRRTLAHLLQQAAQFGGVVFSPPQTANGIRESRAQIRRIKTTLRESGVPVEDEPNDEEPPQSELTPPQPSDGVSGDKVAGDKPTVATGGGDYAEGDIDKREGAFVEGGTVIGDVIGQQINNYYQAPATPLASCFPTTSSSHCASSPSLTTASSASSSAKSAAGISLSIVC